MEYFRFGYVKVRDSVIIIGGFDEPDDLKNILIYDITNDKWWI